MTVSAPIVARIRIMPSDAFEWAQYKAPARCRPACPWRSRHVEVYQCTSADGTYYVPPDLYRGDAMQTPVEIDFQGMDARPKIRSVIAEHVNELERQYGRATACRVVLKAPGGHHRTGGLYEVNIRLALPNGREVNVDRTAPADERHSDLTFAINDAFKRARRQLQDQVSRMQER